MHLAATVSFNALMGHVPSMVLQPQLVDAVTRDLFVEGIDVVVNKRFVDMPQSPPDPAPYQNAIRS